MRDQNHERHKGGADPKSHLPCHPEREPAAQQVAGKSSTQKTPHASGCTGHPCEGADCFDIKAASVVEIFWQPEQVEKPSRVAQKLGRHQSPRFADAKQLNPRRRGRRAWCRKGRRVAQGFLKSFARCMVRPSPPGYPEKYHPPG